MKKSTFTLLLMFIILPLFSTEINFLYMAQSGYQPPDILERAAQFYQETGIKVHVSFPEYEERYDKIMNSMSGDPAVYDVILIDHIWIMDFIRKGYLVSLPDSLKKRIETGIVPEIYSVFKYHDKLWAFPFHADFQLLYVNKNILQKAGFTHPPSTLEEMVFMAEQVKEKGLITYPVFDSWNKQEVLVCEYTWLTGAFGGKLNDSTGKINLLTIPSKRAVTFMVGLLKKKLMNPYSLQADEMFSSEVFLSEDCVFTTNWTFLTELARKSGLPIKDHWMPALIPVSNRSTHDSNSRTASISGYEGLGVLSVSRNKKDAWAFIEFLSSPEFQEEHLDYMSVWKNVWSEDSTLKNDPNIRLKEVQITGVCNRPAAGNYKKISGIIQNWVYRALRMEVSPEQALENAQKEIDEEQN